MKSIKNKLIASVAMLVVATVMMTSASFAWFTVSTAPEVTSVEMTLSATENFEIARATDAGTTEPTEVGAKDGANNTKWGAVVTGFTVQNVDLPATVPADETKKAQGVTGSISNTLTTVTYNADGRTAGLTPATAGTMANTGINTYTVKVNNVDKKCAVVYGLWLRTNVSGTASVEVTEVKTGSATTAAASCTAVTATTGEIVGIAFKVGNTVTPATFDKTNLKYTASLGNISADTATYVEVITYVEGEKVDAADVDAGVKIVLGKVKFSNSAITA